MWTRPSSTALAERRSSPGLVAAPIRKILFALTLAVAAVGIDRFRSGPLGAVTADASPSERVAAAIFASSGLRASAERLQIVPTQSGPMGAGSSVAIFFTATRSERPEADVFRVAARLASNGTPLVLESVANLTQTPDSDEQLLDVVPGCVLFAHFIGGKARGAALLDFDTPAPSSDENVDGWLVRALAALSAWQSYGTLAYPGRFDVALTAPARSLSGHCTETGATLLVDDHLELRLGRHERHLEPAAAGRLQVGIPPAHEAFSLLADALRSSNVVGTARVVALEAALFDLRDWLLRTRHGLFPTAEDRQPVAPSIRTAAAHATGWPPSPLSVPHDEAVLGEGEWSRPFPAGAQAASTDPEGPAVVLRTFLRVDPDRPYERVYLFAFDMRRLGLHFVGGTTDPRSTTGVRGRGTVPAAERMQLVATFNGGFKVDHGVFGAAEGGQVIVPPAPGLATVALDGEGRGRFGVWDLGAELPAEVVALRQNLPPLVAGGVVNPQRMHNWGQLVSRLDESQTPRSALGVTDGGLLIFGWAAATSAELLGEAMRRAGVQFALHLDMNPNHTGLELYRPGPGTELQSLRGAPEMDFRERRWLGVDPRDFFYLTTADGEQRPTSEPQDLGMATPEGPDAPVRLWRLDGVRPQSIPGLAEPAPAARAPGGAAPRLLKLPAAPVFWVDTGVRGSGNASGLVVAGRTWHPPAGGELTLTVDAEGAPALGPWPMDGDPGRFAELLQGTTILRAGVVTAVLPGDRDEVHTPGEGARGRKTPLEAGADGEESPMKSRVLVALGQDSEARLVLAVGAGTSPAGLAQALRGVGAQNAMLLTGRPTPETGQMRFFQLVGDKLYQSDRPQGRKEPANLRPLGGMVLVFTPRTPPLRARVVSTFREE